MLFPRIGGLKVRDPHRSKPPLEGKFAAVFLLLWVWQLAACLAWISPLRPKPGTEEILAQRLASAAPWCLTSVCLRMLSTHHPLLFVAHLLTDLSMCPFVEICVAAKPYDPLFGGGRFEIS